MAPWLQVAVVDVIVGSATVGRVGVGWGVGIAVVGRVALLASGSVGLAKTFPALPLPVLAAFPLVALEGTDASGGVSMSGRGERTSDGVDAGGEPSVTGEVVPGGRLRARIEHCAGP